MRIKAQQEALFFDQHDLAVSIVDNNIEALGEGTTCCSHSVPNSYCIGLQREAILKNMHGQDYGAIKKRCKNILNYWNG
jgi:hypothetical protein